MINFWYYLKEKILILLTRSPSRVRLIWWRDRIASILFFVDTHILRIVAVVLLFFLIFSFSYLIFWRPPSPFPDHALVTIERGMSLSQIAASFEENNVTRSSFWLKTFIMLLGGQKRVVAGDYYFPEPASVFGVAWMLHKGQFGLIPLRITFQEGLSSVDMALILEKELPAFDSNDFKNYVEEGGFEGYLFPDTYFFMPNTKAADVILMMRENFARQIKKYEEDVIKLEKPLEDIITVASIVEGEARDLESKRIVAGIIWRRLKKDMALQVDAPFKYYNGKNSYTLTKDDLAEDHPYNTYKNKGLPPTAINNPGIDSIRAAIAPTQTEYLYFMSDRSGNTYYAKDFEGHKQNRVLYLN